MEQAKQILNSTINKPKRIYKWCLILCILYSILPVLHLFITIPHFLYPIFVDPIVKQTGIFLVMWKVVFVFWIIFFIFLFIIILKKKIEKIALILPILYFLIGLIRILYSHCLLICGQNFQLFIAKYGVWVIIFGPVMILATATYLILRKY